MRPLRIRQRIGVHVQHRTDEGIADKQPSLILGRLGAAQIFFNSPTLISMISETFCDSPIK